MKNNNIKIIRIIARLNIGGPARNAVLLTKELETRGFKTLLVCGEISQGEGDMRYIAQEYGVRPITIRWLTRELSLKKDFQAFWDIFSIIWKEKPDIIHTHTAKAGTLGRLAGICYNLINLIMLRRRRCRLVHTFHGHVFHSYFGKKKTGFFILVERSLAFFTDRLVTVSSALQKELTSDFRIAEKDKISVVELGFDLDELLKLPHKEEGEVIVVGTVGRLTSIKNHAMLFNVAYNIKSRGLGKKVRFVVVGDGELGEELENYAEKLGIKDMIEFKGWIRDLPKIYKELDIVSLTSLNEGTPVSLIEAMAAGRSVISTNVGGVSDVIEDGKSGYLVTPGNADEFTEKLMDLVKDPAKREEFGRNGRILVEKRFSKERLVNDMAKLYNDILKKEQR
ncbi:MAG: glycosyltransferase family 4 protein [Candidatus Omnitrophota bacterium]